MIKNLYAKFAILIGVVALTIYLLPAGAAGVDVTLHDDDGADDEDANGSSTEINVRWDPSAQYPTGTEVTISITPPATEALADCAPPTDFLGDASGDGNGSFGSFTSSSAIYTLTSAMPVEQANACLAFKLDDTNPTNYSVSLQTASSTDDSTPVDFGAALYYVLGGHQVTVTAEVPASLSFDIRNSADTANTNVCDLGILTLNDVNYCDYRLKIATNASNGFRASVEYDEVFNSNGNATLTAITNDASFTTGTEAYGIALLQGAATGGRSGTGDFDQPLNEDTVSPYTWDADSTPLTWGNASAVRIIYYDAPFNATTGVTSSTTLVRHGAAISAGTPTGNYQHTLEYKVTGSF